MPSKKSNLKQKMKLSMKKRVAKMVPSIMAHMKKNLPVQRIQSTMKGRRRSRKMKGAGWDAFASAFTKGPAHFFERVGNEITNHESVGRAQYLPAAAEVTQYTKYIDPTGVSALINKANTVNKVATAIQSGQAQQGATSALDMADSLLMSPEQKAAIERDRQHQEFINRPQESGNDIIKRMQAEKNAESTKRETDFYNSAEQVKLRADYKKQQDEEAQKRIKDAKELADRSGYGTEAFQQRMDLLQAHGYSTNPIDVARHNAAKENRLHELLLQEEQALKDSQSKTGSGNIKNKRPKRSKRKTIGGNFFGDSVKKMDDKIVAALKSQQK